MNWVHGQYGIWLPNTNSNFFGHLLTMDDSRWCQMVAFELGFDGKLPWVKKIKLLFEAYGLEQSDVSTSQFE